MSNGNQLLSHDSSYPDGDITITHFKTNFAKEKLPNFNDVSNVERNSESTPATAGRQKYALEARCLKGISKPKFE